MLIGFDATQNGATPDGVHLPPPPAAHLLPRPALVARIDAAVRGALTVLAAPAGYGKTAVLTQWAASTVQLVAWMQSRDDTSAATLQSAIAHTIELADSRPLVIVVEAVDRLDTDARPTLGELIESAVPTTRFVVTSRSREIFPEVLARLRMRDDLAVLTADDLAFTRDDVKAILERNATMPPGSDDVDARWQLTGGWPAAVLFGEGDGSFAEYCRAEILVALPEPLQHFVLATAQLDRFTEGLSRATTANADAPAMVRELERLLLVEREPVARDGDAWFRYRAPFGAIARETLIEREPEGVLRVLVAASNWHVRRASIGDLNDAATYYARARRWAGLLIHVTRSTPRLYNEGRVRDALRWMTAIPEWTRHAHPDGVILEATLYTLVGETRRASQVLRAVEGRNLSSEQMWAIALARALWVQGHLPPDDAIAAADDAMQHLDAARVDLTRGTASHDRVATMLAIARARALWYLGDPRGARRALELSNTSAATAAVQICGLLAQIEAQRGSLRRAERHITDAEEIALENLRVDHPLLVTAALAHVHVLIERGETVRAQVALARAEELSRSLDFETIRTEIALERARLALSANEPADGLEALDSVSELARPPLLDARSRAIGARLALTLGDVNEARRRLGWAGTTVFPKMAAVATQLALATDDVAGARAVVAGWPAPLHEGDLLLRALWQAAVEFAEGHRDDALERIADVAPHAASDRRVRVFLDGVAELRPLLTLAARDEPGGFLSSILRAERRTPENDRSIARPALSPRERAVLESLAQRLTYAEIADRLFISQNTVKSHAKSLYTKLGVGGRRDAVERAEVLGLL